MGKKRWKVGSEGMKLGILVRGKEDGVRVCVCVCDNRETMRAGREGGRE